MIRKTDECKVEIREHMRDGDGQVRIQNFVDSGELYEKGRLFARLTLEPGCSIGFHVHENDSEIFYFLSGTGEYDDNGVKKEVHAGDIAICPAGTGHGIRNIGEDTLSIIALIVYA